MKILMKLRNILPIENGLFKISTKHSGLNTLDTTFIILEMKRIKMDGASTAIQNPKRLLYINRK